MTPRRPTGARYSRRNGHSREFITFANINSFLREVGEGTVDIAPPLGIEMAGFHRAQGNERRIKGIRQAPVVRALVLRHGSTEAAIVSLEAITVSREMVGRVRKRISEKLGIPAANIHLSATHTHSMPTFRFFLQWGAIAPEYTALVEQRIVQAIAAAKADLAPAELQLGKSRADPLQ